MANFPTETDDDIDGTPNADIIDSLGGNDRIDGGDGDDDLDGGSGSDVLNGEGGDDTLRVSGGGNNNANGGAGLDSLVLDWASATNAVIDNSAASPDEANGGYTGGFYNYTDGAAVQYSGIERFVIATGSGNDTLTTGTGNDIVSTGGGDDFVNLGSGLDQADGGAGTDGLSVDMSAVTEAVTWSLQTNVYMGPEGTSFTNFEYFSSVRTGSGDDIIVTGALLRGETIQTGAGDDKVFVSGGGDSVAMGTGTDTLAVDYGNATAAVVDNGPPGTADANGGFSGGWYNYSDGSSVGYSGVEHFIIITGSGNDSITTATGNDIVSTGAGDDVVNVSTGTDQADGGAGTDGISADMANATVSILWDLETDSYSGPEGTSFKAFEYFGTVETGSGDDVIATTALYRSEAIHTGSGNDHITILSGTDTVIAGAGIDTLVVDYSAATSRVIDNGAPASDGANGGFQGGWYNYTDGSSVGYSGVEHFIVTTGKGNDSITTATGNDIVNTGLGDDAVNVGTGTDQADGGDGLDGISADMSNAAAAIHWDLQANSYAGPEGTSFANFEYFGTVKTGSGNDRIITGLIAQSESIQTGAGDDYILVGGGTDSVAAGTGFDTLVVDYSSATARVIDNGPPSADGTNGGLQGGWYNYTDGSSVNYSGIDRFLVRTGLGDDIITTAGGDDEISTGAGNDTVNGAGGNDLVDGGAGNDGLNGGEGEDTLSYRSATAEVTVSLATAAAQDTLGAGVDTVLNFENLLGSIFADDLTGNALANVLDGGTGADVLRGGAGNDVYIVDDADDDVIELDGEGTDEVRTVLGTYTLAAYTENLVFTGTGSFNAFGNALGNVITGGASNDAFLLFDGGNDTAEGGGGNDFIYYGAALTAEDINRGGAGTDTVALLGDYDLTLGAETLAGVERLVFYSGTLVSGPHVDYTIATIDANVAAGAQLTVNAPSLLGDESLVFNGTAETDGSFYIQSGAGADTLAGGAKDDILRGGAGDDFLYGIGGNDRLVGGLGADALRGGFGGDRFVYESASDSTAGSRDSIVDFEHLVDRIDLRGVDAIAGTPENEAFSFIGSTAFSEIAGELRAYRDGGQWFVEGDTNGDGAADFAILVNVIGGSPLTTGDFAF